MVGLMLNLNEKQESPACLWSFIHTVHLSGAHASSFGPSDHISSPTLRSFQHTHIKGSPEALLLLSAQLKDVIYPSPKNHTALAGAVSQKCLRLDYMTQICARSSICCGKGPWSWSWTCLDVLQELLLLFLPVLNADDKYKTWCQRQQRGFEGGAKQLSLRQHFYYLLLVKTWFLFSQYVSLKLLTVKQ